MRALHLAWLAIVLGPMFATAAEPKSPNIVIVFTDDQGYGDLGCFGATGFETPNIDRLAKEGVRFTDFHVSQPVCSASRASLLTGCYANRIGIHGALGPNAQRRHQRARRRRWRKSASRRATPPPWSASGTSAIIRSSCPTRHGFDDYFGLPYSNDMWPHHPERPKGYPNLPLIEDEKIVNPDVTAADQPKLTTQYTEQAVQFIREHKDGPFFLYVRALDAARAALRQRQVQGQVEAGSVRRRDRGDRLVGRARS